MPGWRSSARTRASRTKRSRLRSSGEPDRLDRGELVGVQVERAVHRPHAALRDLAFDAKTLADQLTDLHSPEHYTFMLGRKKRRTPSRKPFAGAPRG